MCVVFKNRIQKVILESKETDIRILGIKCLGDQLEIFTNSEIQSQILNTYKKVLLFCVVNY